MKRLCVAIVCLLSLQFPGRLAAQMDPGIITTFAGKGILVFSGDGGPATQAGLSNPIGMAVDAKGNIYIADTNNHRIRRVGPDGAITTFAGTGAAEFSGDGGPATQAGLYGPTGVAVDAKGNVYIADRSNHRIRRVGPDGNITTFAGMGIPGFSGDGGPATLANLNNPLRVAVDTAGVVYIADTNNHRIRRVGPDGNIATFAGKGTAGFSGDGGPATQASLNSPDGLAVDTKGNVYIADSAAGRVRRVGPDGNILTIAGTGGVGFSGDGVLAAQATLYNPAGVAVDAKGNVYIADRYNHRIRRVGPDGLISTFAGTVSTGFAGDGGPAIQALLSEPQGVAVDTAGVVYIADTNNHRIRRVGPDGNIATVAGAGSPGFSGDGGPAIQALLAGPKGLAVDTAGVVYIADTNNHRIRRVGPDGNITTVAGAGSPGFSGDGGPATKANLNEPHGVAVDARGNIYIADTRNRRIRRVGPDGNITTLAGTGEAGFAGDGGPATQAKFHWPTGVAVDTAGVVYIADRNNHRIRRVGLNGVITTLAGTGVAGVLGDGGPAAQASLNYPNSVAVDKKRSVYIADTENHRIRWVKPDSTISTFAGTGVAGFSGDGGPAVQASLNYPNSVAAGPDGSVYFADRDNSRIRRVGPDGFITTVAGTGVSGRSGDGGLATNARLAGLAGVAVDAKGNLYISDNYRQIVRRVQAGGPVGVPSIRLSASVVTFDNTRPGSASQKTLIISNTGGGSLSVTGIAVRGRDAALFAVSQTAFGIVAGGQPDTLTLTFAPTSAGIKSAALYLTHNAAGSPSIVSLSGAGIDTSSVPASGAQVSVGTATGSRGGTVTVPISVNNAAGIAGGDLALSYNPTVLTAVQIQPGNLLTSGGITAVSNLSTTGQVRISMAGATGLSAGSGPLVSVVFTIKPDAKDGTYPLTLQAGLNDQNGKAIPFAAVAGAVTVTSGLIGDVNGDGQVNSGDAILALRYSAGLIALTDQQKNLGDVNGDGQVNSGDAILILRYSAGLITKFPRQGASKPAALSDDAMRSVQRGEVKMGEARATPQGMEVPLVLGTGIHGGDLTLTYDPATYGNAQVKGSPGILIVTNVSRPGEVRLSVARTNAAESAVLWVTMEGRGEISSFPPHPSSSVLQVTGQVFGPDGWPVGAVEGLTDRPLTSSLSIFPNPFNPSTVIHYDLAEEGEVRLTIYNTFGQVVRSLVSGRQSAGRYSVVWDGRDDAGRTTASGLYIGRLDAGAFHQAQKMLLLK